MAYIYVYYTRVRHGAEIATTELKLRGGGGGGGGGVSGQAWCIAGGLIKGSRRLFPRTCM